MTAQQRQHTVAPQTWQAAPRVAARPVATVAGAAERVRSLPPKPASAPAPRPAPVPRAAAPVIASPEPPAPEPHREERAALPALRIVCWQLAVVLAFAAIGRPWPVVVGLLLAAATLLACTALRVRGRWVSDELVLRARRRLRRRGHEAASGHALLETLAPGATIRTVEVAGTPAAVISRREELVAVLRAHGDPATLVGQALPVETTETPVVKLQLVLHRGPHQTDSIRMWLAVRALREPGFATDTELLVVLGNVVRKLHRTLRKAGLDASALTEQEVSATLVALTHTGSGRGAVREDRRYWRAGPITQVGLRVTGLRPGRTAVQALHGLLAAAPGTARTVAITGHEAVLRVAATTDHAADTAVARLLWMPPHGLRLERMDNQHAPAVAASLPIGGNR